MKVSRRCNEQGFNLADPLTPSILDLSLQNKQPLYKTPDPFYKS
jgi:hypothetical protein